MTVDDIPRAAKALLGAYETGEPIQPLIDTYPGLTLHDAYRIQQEQVRAWTDAGDVIRGHKIGLASAAIQRQMGVGQPDYGHLMASMFHLEQAPIPARRFIQPRIEAEIAFVLGAPLQGPGVTVADAVRAVEFLLPALEIVDSRIEDWRLSIADTVADNASSGGVILGSAPARLGDVDIRLAGCALKVNGRVVDTGISGAVLGSPLNSLVWLANTIGALGVALEPGHVVLSGSMTTAVPVRPGDHVSAGVAGLGDVTTVLSEEELSGAEGGAGRHGRTEK